MSAPFPTYKHGKVIVPDDANDQPYYTRVVCITAGNLVFRVIDATTGLESASITIAMTPTQTLDVVPKKVMATGITGTYLGQISG